MLKPAKLLPPAEPTDSNSLMLYGVCGLAALVGGAYFMRRRAAQLGPAASIDVIAQRALGGKAKIMWLAAGERELLIAVTAQQVRMLGQWPRNQRAPHLAKAQALPATQQAPIAQPTAAAAFMADADDVELPPAPLVTKSSPAVSGILKLRDRAPRAQTPPPVSSRNVMALMNEEVSVDDPELDMAWAKEMLAAVKGYR